MGESRSATKKTTFQALIDAGLLEIGDGYRAKNDELGGTGPLFLRAGHVSDTHISFDGVERFRAELADAVASKMSKPGDVVITTKGNSTGRTTFVTPDFPPFVYSPHLSYWRSKDPRAIVPGFLRAWSNGAEFSEQLEGMKLSTDMAPYLSLTDQRRLHITLPPSDEQRAIARVLGGLDDKIELNRRMNRTLEDLARGLFRSWFVDFDPVTRNGSAKSPPAPTGLFPKRLVDSPLGPIPEGWRPGGIADLARFVNGRNFTKNATGNGRMVVRIAELNSGPAGSTVYNDVKADPENVVVPGELLFAWSGSLDVYRWHREEALVNQHIFKVVCETYPQWFVHFHLCEAMSFFQGIAADKATTMGHIKREHLRQAELALPTDAVLEYASAHIDPIYARLLANERESLRLAALRDALLPELLSGEIRLRDTARLVDDSTPVRRTFAVAAKGGK